MDSYEKKYKEMKARVLEIGQGYVKGVDFSKPRQIAEYIDPELVESEDERIRKALIDGFKRYDDGALFNGCLVREILVWLENQNSNADNANKEYWRGYREGKQEVIDKYAELEKQGEEKPAWSEEDEQLIDEVVVCLRKYAEKVQGGYSKSYVQSLADRIESLRPGNTCKATEWSEEDEAMFQGVIETEQYMLDVVYGRKIFAVGNEDLKEECTKELAWLKSLKDRIK